MHDQLSGYKRLRRDHQAALQRLEEQCRAEMEKHKQMLDREYEQLLTQFSRELERLQLKHLEELGKRVSIHRDSKSGKILWVALENGPRRKACLVLRTTKYQVRSNLYIFFFAPLPVVDRSVFVISVKEQLYD